MQRLKRACILAESHLPDSLSGFELHFIESFCFHEIQEASSIYLRIVLDQQK